ncbi:uncharacterized protein LOC133524388 [Cydia pomonella]|uniref:uncharacterized protein LOC133524388 n=1 Tax=Cydia pomonella TaxID=82600 RepID=UPI002ADE25A3|nr:uncharacterized protein LOC133524388 [Cydia pomonella]
MMNPHPHPPPLQHPQIQQIPHHQQVLPPPPQQQVPQQQVPQQQIPQQQIQQQQPNRGYSLMMALVKNSKYFDSERLQAMQDTPGLPKLKRSRKKIRDTSTWEINKVKKAREQGKPYLTQKRIKGVKVGYEERKKRVMGPACMSRVCHKSSKRKCDQLDDVSRQECFDSFWSEMTWAQRKAYISALVNIYYTRTTTVPNGESRRHRTIKYSLKINNQHWPVCKKMFLNTLGLGEKTVLGWIEKANEHGVVSTPVRKNNKERYNREKLIHVETYLKNLPKLPSHYFHGKSEKEYLDINFNSGKEVYLGYKMYLAKEGIKDKEISYPCFLRKMNALNIALFSPKKKVPPNKNNAKPIFRQEQT